MVSRAELRLRQQRRHPFGATGDRRCEDCQRTARAAQMQRRVIANDFEAEPVGARDFAEAHLMRDHWPTCECIGREGVVLVVGVNDAAITQRAFGTAQGRRCDQHVNLAKEMAQEVYAVNAELQHHAAADFGSAEEPVAPVRPGCGVTHASGKDFSGLAAGDQFARYDDFLEVAMHEADLQGNACVPRRRNDFPAFGRCRRHRLLQQNSFTARGRRAGDLTVRVVRCSDHHGVDIAPIEQRAPVVRRTGDRVQRRRLIGAATATRCDGAQICTAGCLEPRDVIVGDEAGADDADADFVACVHAFHPPSTLTKFGSTALSRPVCAYEIGSMLRRMRPAASR